MKTKKNVMEIEIRHLKEIVRLGKKPKKELRKINHELERLYTGAELTKYQLIYQIVFLMDAPCKE
jgi:hypothetical protein